MCVTPRRIFAASWVAGGLLFAFILIVILSWDPYGGPVFNGPFILIIGIVATMVIATDLAALWVLVEVGSLTGVVNFQPKFKRSSEGVAVSAVGLLGSFLFMVVITIAAFLVINYFFK